MTVPAVTGSTGTFDGATLLATLRGERDVDDVCRAAGATQAEFAAARDAYLRRRLPRAGRVAAAVGGTVEILRDRAGIPHIYAASTEDLYFGLGFATAGDRLWQMDRLRRRAYGLQAEVLGATYVHSDLTHRTVGIREIAAAEVERLDEPTRRLVTAYVRGVNRAVEACGRDLPVEFAILGYEPEPFTVRDVVAILRGMWWSLNGRLEYLAVAEAARLLPDGPLRDAYLTPEAPELRIVPGAVRRSADGAGDGTTAAGMGDATGSNNWAVAGRRAASGHALLASDPHQPFWLPTSWYEFSLHGPEDDAAGVGHPGVPGIWFGANGDTAWGVTNNNASTRDLYAETVHPDDPGRYRDGATWHRFDERTETIRVRSAAPREIVVRATVRGPIVNPTLPMLDALATHLPGGDPPLSLRWVGQEHLDDIRALVAVGRARDWAAFRAALRHWAVPVFNFGYADREGRAGYQCAGRIPLRGRVARGFREAGNPADTWQGYVPFDDLPRMDDPPRGYVASANNRVAGDDYPHPLYGAWAAGHRATRLEQHLGAGSAETPKSTAALQNDVASARAARLCPPLLRHLASLDDPAVRTIADLMEGWDYRYTPESRAALAFEVFMRHWQAHVAAARFPAALVPFVATQGGPAARLIEAADLPWFELYGNAAAPHTRTGGAQDKPATPAPGQHPAAVSLAPHLAAAAGQAVDWLARRLGADRGAWTWGAVHRAHWRHPVSNTATTDAFDLGPAIVDGCADTVRNTGSSVEFGADSGAEYRLIVDFATPDRFVAVQNAGNSGQPGSPHYADQFPDWLTGRYHTVHLRRAAVEQDSPTVTTLVPGVRHPTY